ncbi:MAG: YggS family pyridoxal phosphate-dependent enzyme [Acidobacteriota bacterium]|nr:YggS family pyridoxal phosphate-dependent enzyme [Acidobacteriota bacterium]
MSDPDDALREIRDRIEAACARSGRPEQSVALVAVSKTVSSERVRAMLDRGHDLFGENRVQEALAKIPEVGPGARWHLIGHLQRNKVRHSVGVFELIHAVDDSRLANEIDKRAAAAGVRQAVLVQVDLAGEETKHGVAGERVEELVEEIFTLDGVELRGLMVIPPWPERPEDSRPYFVALRELRDSLAGRTGRELPELSMGMTDDFEVAVEEGATLVRVGRALFGDRP